MSRRPLQSFLAFLVFLAFLSPVAHAQTSVSDAESVLRQLTESYGVSGHEAAVRETVIHLLPSWASPRIDSAGNIRIRYGHGQPLIVFVAHLDEIGFEVTAIRDDGQLVISPVGGMMTSLFEAEPALVHTAHGDVPAVFTLRDSIGPTVRHLPSSVQSGRTVLQYRVDPGTTTRAATEALGIAVGDWVTMPKHYVPLAGTRATARSFDDRVGCAAQILALRRIDPRRARRAVEFIFTTREETGLFGAQAAAAELATEHPARVYALDTFVSSDAPLEIKTFADAPLGKGPVARAVDNSSVTPPALLDSLVALARQRGIPLQVGTTNGGNDGSTFTRWGVADVPVGWPLRYSHSPAEVIDVRDLAAMSDLVAAIAERW